MKKRSRSTAQDFAAKFRAALADFDHESRRLLEQGAPLPPLSINAFLKRYGLARSTSYGRHRSLVTDLERCIEELRDEKRIRKENRPTIKSLTAENVALRALVKRRIAKVASVNAADLLVRLRPGENDRFKLIYDVQRLEEEVERLNLENENLRKQVASLLTQLSDQ